MISPADYTQPVPLVWRFWNAGVFLVYVAGGLLMGRKAGHALREERLGPAFAWSCVLGAWIGVCIGAFDPNG